jgi:serine/threonine-protein kinase
VSEVKPSDDAARVSIAETMAADGVVSAAPSDPAVASLTSAPQRVADRYEILNLLGMGGMGAVYRARDVELDELVALKVLRRELVDSPAMLARFRQEAKLARRVTHRNVARTFDIGEHAGEKFLTMEFVDGESLDSVVAKRGRLSLAEVGHVAHEVLAGMTAAHAAGVVHRDLKPENVLVGKDGRVVVTDFGIARGALGSDGAAKTMGALVGTPSYMAPEQVEGSADIDARADIYAFGAMLYELLTGVRAWPGDAPLVVAAARLINPPPDPRDKVPSIPAAVSAVVLRCLERKREGRFASASEVSAALGAAISASTSSSVDLAATGSVEAIPQASSGARATPASPTMAVRQASPSLSLGLDKTIAVLPFKNGGPPEDDYLADGITDDLIDVLSMTPGLKVRPRGAVAKLGSESDPRAVGAELGVQVVVLGSVRKTPAAIRVSARLVSTSDGFQLWAKRFDRPAADLLGINDEAATAIAEALTIAGPAQAREAPSNPLAIDLYMRAQHEFHKFWKVHVERAVELYEEALQLAPDDPTILAGCARARVRLAFFGGEEGERHLIRAREAADRAVAAAPDRGESWLALGASRFIAGDAPGAVRAAVTALEKSKNLAPAHDLLGRILLEVRPPREGISHLKAALELDPSDMAPRFELARGYALLRQWDEMNAVLDLPAPGPLAVSRYIYRARLCVWWGHTHPDLDNPPPLGEELKVYLDPKMLVMALETRELPEALRQGLEHRANSADPRSRRSTFLFQLNAEYYAFGFEVDAALDAVAGAVRSGLIDINWMDLCPPLEPVRKDARFAPLRAEVAARAATVVRALVK